jgi:hypothetical protein
MEGGAEGEALTGVRGRRPIRGTGVLPTLSALSGVSQRRLVPKLDRTHSRRFSVVKVEKSTESFASNNGAGAISQSMTAVSRLRL